MKLPARFQKVLLFAIMDMLSVCAYPKETDNRKRFVDLIDRYSGWMYRDRVSLIELSHLIVIANDRSGDRQIRNLGADVKSRLASWPTRPGIYYCTLDPLRADFESYDSCEKCVKLIKRARYPSCLWSMRNVWMHEGRDPSQVVTVARRPHDVPVYQASKDPAGGPGLNKGLRWEFYVSAEAILQVLRGRADNLRKDCEERHYNPDDSFPVMLAWHRR